MIAMRAKMRLTNIDRSIPGQERLSFSAVAAAKYGEDGSDEDNTYARFTPDGRVELCVANPALHGQFHKGEDYYVDFTLAGAAPVEAPAPTDDPQPTE